MVERRWRREAGSKDEGSRVAAPCEKCGQAEGATRVTARVWHEDVVRSGENEQLGTAMDPTVVYVAGPLFNRQEREAQAAIAAALEARGMATFLPQRDGLEMMRLAEAGVPRAALERAVFALDVFQVVERCGALVANGNGAVLDDGTVVEMTAAALMGHPVVLLRADDRTTFDGVINPMVTGVTDVCVATAEAAAAEVKALLVLACACPCPSQRALPPRVAAAVSRGRELWRAKAAGDDVAAVVARIFADC